MQRSVRSTFNAQICRQACEWFVEFRTGEPDEGARRAFHAWLQESPQHMRAYLQITALWSAGSQIDREQKWSIESLIAESAAAAAASNVVSLQNDAETTVRSEFRGVPRAQRSRLRTWTIAAGALLVIAVGVSTWAITQRNVYETAIGEHRSIILADGSTVTLNSASRIRVRYSDRERAVDLREGQALFDVARNPARPFIVTSSATRVRAVGTRFDVYRKLSGTIVTVIEGRVAVLPGESARGPSLDAHRSVASVASRSDTHGGSTPFVNAQETPQPEHVDSPDAALPATQLAITEGEVFVDAGQQLRVAADSVSRPMPAQVERVTSWTQRQLVFDSTPLAEVAEEFNRYNERQLIIENAALASFRIDGVFSSTDPASLLRFLRARPDMEVVETRREIIIAPK